MDKIKILVKSIFLDESVLHILRSSFNQAEFYWANNQEEFLKLIPEVDILWGDSLTPELLKAAKKLRWMHTVAAGVETMLFPEFVESPIPLTAGKGVHAIQMAEHVFALILAFTRNLSIAFEAKGRSEWMAMDLSRKNIGEIYERTMGIIGLGGIGMEVAKRAKGLGMNVIAVKRSPSPKPDFVDELYLEDKKMEVLSKSDFVVLALPSTPSTQKVIGEEELRAMKPYSYIVNVGRGSAIDEEDLVKALREGWIGGAGLDVFSEEPLPSTSPLWNLANVVMTPHTSGGSPHIGRRSVEFFCENLRRFLVGEELLNIVDKKEGY